ncbi:hypothetical protein M3Y98_00583500 [Aphelenchoides besseyi]|nr:hypothetical protein M3Y98_00583500 [Aphelenchoides besseyi]
MSWTNEEKAFCAIEYAKPMGSVTVQRAFRRHFNRNARAPVPAAARSSWRKETSTADLDSIGEIAQTPYQTLCPTDTHVSTVETMNTEIDRPIFSILCKKLPEMLKQICENSVSWWFPVHLCDLFQKLDPSVITMLGEQIQQSSGRETANFGAAETRVFNHSDSV